MEDRAICLSDGGMTAVEVLLLHFVHQILGFVEFDLEFAHFGEECTEICVKPARKKRLVVRVETLGFSFGSIKIPSGLLVIALGLLADGFAIDDQHAPCANNLRSRRSGSRGAPRRFLAGFHSWKVAFSDEMRNAFFRFSLGVSQRFSRWKHVDGGELRGGKSQDCCGV